MSTSDSGGPSGTPGEEGVIKESNQSSLVEDVDMSPTRGAPAAAFVPDKEAERVSQADTEVPTPGPGIRRKSRDDLEEDIDVSMSMDRAADVRVAGTEEDTETLPPMSTEIFELPSFANLDDDDLDGLDVDLDLDDEGMEDIVFVAQSGDKVDPRDSSSKSNSSSGPAPDPVPGYDHKVVVGEQHDSGSSQVLDRSTGDNGKDASTARMMDLDVGIAGTNNGSNSKDTGKEPASKVPEDEASTASSSITAPNSGIAHFTSELRENQQAARHKGGSTSPQEPDASAAPAVSSNGNAPEGEGNVEAVTGETDEMEGHALREILQKLAESRGDGEGDGDGDGASESDLVVAASADARERTPARDEKSPETLSLWNSPISDLPDLPTELPPSPEAEDLIIVAPLPRPLEPQPGSISVRRGSSAKNSGPAPASHAESSSTAIKRAQSAKNLSKPKSAKIALPKSMPRAVTNAHARTKAGSNLASKSDTDTKPIADNDTSRPRAAFWDPIDDSPISSWTTTASPAKRARPDPGKYKDLDPKEAFAIDDLESENEGEVMVAGGARGGSMKSGHGKEKQQKKRRADGGVGVDPSVKRPRGPTKRSRQDSESEVARNGAATTRKPAQRSKSNPKTPGTGPASKLFTDSKIKQDLKGKTREVQMAVCQRSRYAQWGKCCQCVAKVGGDSCRFKGFRVFKIDPETSEILEPGYFASTEPLEEITPLPSEFNVPWEESHILRTEQTVAAFLLPLISKELRHAVNRNAVVRHVDAAVNRSVCDFCSSTIFGGFFICKKCGRDYCLQCERYFSDSLETIRDSPWDIPDAARPRLLRCTNLPKDVLGQSNGAGARTDAEGRRTRHCFHIRPDLQPVSRFNVEALKEHWVRLVEFVLDGADGDVDVGVDLSDAADVEKRTKLLGLGLGAEDTDLAGAVRDWLKIERPARKESGNSKRQINPTPISGESKLDLSRYYTKSTRLDVKTPIDPAGLQDRSQPFMLVNVDQLDDDLFDTLWSRGEPIVVDNVGKRFKKTWTPETFIARFGKEPCHVIECQSEAVREMTVGDFFRIFQNADVRSGKIYKLKDWPSTNDFQSAYPDLYNDFCDSLPVPNFTRREGVLNLYAHFPPGPTKPDIGPKMYNAFTANEDVGGQGSTRLHMDVADAINIMLYASPRPKPRLRSAPGPKSSGPHSLFDSSAQAMAPEQDRTEVEEEKEVEAEPGCAVWDLFRAEDADKIRLFLKRKFGNQVVFTDPIHSQVFYLDAGLRKELADKYGVVSWRVYQYPGQAVFIPAGCAHQVCNLADCIKIALDFVSPHNVARCLQLVHDFRKENYIKAWKDDVLQLYNVMWYAWLNARETRQRRKDQADQARLDQLADQDKKKAAAEYLAQLHSGDIPSAARLGNGLSVSITSKVNGNGEGPASPHLRNGFFSPAVSSVRDEPAPAPLSVSARSRAATPEAEADAGDKAGGDTSQAAKETVVIDPALLKEQSRRVEKAKGGADSAEEAQETAETSATRLESSKQSATADAPPSPKSKDTSLTETDKVDKSQRQVQADLIERILRHTLSQIDPPPPSTMPPANGGAGAVGVAVSAIQEETKPVVLTRMSERKQVPLGVLIKRGMLPVDVGLSFLSSELEMEGARVRAEVKAQREGIDRESAMEMDGDGGELTEGGAGNSAAEDLDDAGGSRDTALQDANLEDGKQELQEPGSTKTDDHAIEHDGQGDGELDMLNLAMFEEDEEHIAALPTGDPTSSLD